LIEEKEMKTLQEIMASIALRRREAPTHIGNNYYVHCQEKWGSSIWAKWVANGDLSPHYIWWCWRTFPGGTRNWIAFYIDSGHGKGKFFDLRDPEQKKALRELEKTTAKWIASRRTNKSG
jgi:hypothetical protein